MVEKQQEENQPISVISGRAVREGCTATIPKLFQLILARVNQWRPADEQIISVTEEVIEVFEKDSRLRSLQDFYQIFEHAASICEESTLRLEHLPPRFRESATKAVKKCSLPAPDDIVHTAA